MSTLENTKTTTFAMQVERIRDVIAHICGHLDQPLLLGELCEVAEYSPFHFHRVFSGIVGEGVSDFVRRLRLERSAHRLRESDRPIVEVALEAKYATHEAFTRAFGKAYGVSPRTYRQLTAVETSLPTISNVHYSSSGAVKFIPLCKGVDQMEVRIEQVQARRLAGIRAVGWFPETIPATFPKLCQYAEENQLFGPNTEVMVLYPMDNNCDCEGDCCESKKADLKCDVCISIPEDFTPSGIVNLIETAGGQYAITVHKGPYDGLKSAWCDLFSQWVPQNGYAVAKDSGLPSYERYLNDPKNVKPEELLTELAIPVEKA